MVRAGGCVCVWSHEPTDGERGRNWGPVSERSQGKWLMRICRLEAFSSLTEGKTEMRGLWRCSKWNQERTGIGGISHDVPSAPWRNGKKIIKAGKVAWSIFRDGISVQSSWRTEWFRKDGSTQLTSFHVRYRFRRVFAIPILLRYLFS